MKWSMTVFGVALSAVVAATAEVRTEPWGYAAGDTQLKGVLAYPTELEAPRPAVIVIHDWMGCNDFAVGRARALAEAGYIALAADMYGGGKVAENTREAGRLAGGLKAGDRAEMRRRAMAALEAVKSFRFTDPDRVAIIGYCFGGTVALEAARSGAPLRAAVSIHGNLDTPQPEATSGRLRAAVLVLHGADDPYVKPEEIEAFEREMRAAKADWQMICYSGAVHSFANPSAGNDPSRGAAYNAVADRRSWQHLLVFFRDIFDRPDQLEKP